MIRLVLGVVLSLCPLCLCGEIPAVLNSTDEHALHLALRALKMTERDLGFSKTNVESEMLLPQACQLLQHPLELPSYANNWLTKLTGCTNLAALTSATSTTGTSASDTNQSCMTATDNYLRILVMPICSAAQTTMALLPSPDKPAFEAEIIEMLSADNDKRDLAFSYFSRAQSLELGDCELADAILVAAEKLDRKRLELAFTELTLAVDRTLPLLLAMKESITNSFVESYDTTAGTVVFGGAGPNVYTNEAFLIIDFGGDDVYLNTAGGANGLAGRPISIVIDLAGNDQFVAKRSFSQGSGVFGIGILAALGSNCTFQAKHFSQGAGFFGCGILMTGDGKHTFEADTFCQGAGMFGTGILWQRGGNTTYTANKYAQGFGGIQGCGLVLDAAGNDTYIAGGKEACGWLTGHYFTLSQGFGYGMRPYAGGGVGILCDLKGDDHYKADVYGQGASYWYAVGLLIDAEGNDTYDAHQYCQGAGIHLSTGALIDWAGNDTYTAHAICQGGAHDYSVGMLIDRAGNDRYTGDSTAQGTAINNSFALLLDHAGDDSYTGTDPKQSQAAGHDGDKRKYGSIALLLDLAGKDTYSQGQSNNAAWLKPLYGAGLDYESPTAGVATPLRGVPAVESNPNTSQSRVGRDAAVVGGNRLYTLPPVDPHHPTERLFRLATSDRPDAGKAWAELKTNAVAHLPYLITRLNSPNVMVRVKFEELVDHLDTNSIPLLIAGIQSTKDDEVARLCCYFLARFGDKPPLSGSGSGFQPRPSTSDVADTIRSHVISAILPLLKRRITRPTAFYTLGHLRAAEAYRPAVEALRESRELVRLRATQALGNTGNRRAIPHLIRQLDDEIYDVRYAAQDALVAFGPSALSQLHSAYERATPRAKPHLLEALAKLGDDRALDLARHFYRNDDPLIRDAILRSLKSAPAAGK